MSLLFFIIALILYSICQGLAKRTSLSEKASETHVFTATGDLQLATDATLDWLASKSELHIKPSSGKVIIAEQKRSLLSFGAYFSFYISSVDEKIEIKIEIRPRLVSTTYESQMISKNYQHFVENVLRNAS